MSDGGPGKDKGAALAPSVEFVWGLRERPAKGPRRGLSLAQIVDAAVNIAAAEGLAAVSMSRVAAAIGSAPMSLYRYVASKDELLALMADMAAGDPPAPAESEWRAGLSRWAWAYRGVLRRHPWMLGIPLSGPPIMPNQVAWLESGLDSLRATNLHEEEKLSSMLLINGFVRNDAALTAAILAAAAAAGSTVDDVMPAYGRVLARLTGPGRFPALHRALAAGAFEIADDKDDEFIFGLERILDGIDVLVRLSGRA